MNPHEFQSIERNRFPLSICSRSTSVRSQRQRAFFGGFCLGIALMLLIAGVVAEILAFI